MSVSLSERSPLRSSPVPLCADLFKGAHIHASFSAKSQTTLRRCAPHPAASCRARALPQGRRSLRVRRLSPPVPQERRSRYPKSGPSHSLGCLHLPDFALHPHSELTRCRRPCCCRRRCSHPGVAFPLHPCFLALSNFGRCQLGLLLPSLESSLFGTGGKGCLQRLGPLRSLRDRWSCMCRS